MSKSKKQRKKKSSRCRNQGAKPQGVSRQRAAPCDLTNPEFLELLRENVPFGSGTQSYGVGRYSYDKIAWDGSMRRFRLSTRRDVRIAMQIGMAADRPLHVGSKDN